ncbi:transcription factor bHLH113-like isoform X2 [Primulina eburnea]|uniref:transcription factor bHLH113-like isoform X2 n=1 Tax=Primulina eburnea TaxID=1245227 RepID=UPI003C6C310C
MMAGNPNWWSMNSMHPQFSSQFVFGSNPSLSPNPSESDTQHHQDFPARGSSWSQLLLGGLAVNEEENKFGGGLVQQQRKLQENSYQDLQVLNLNPSFTRDSEVDIKQDYDLDYDHHHQFQANRSSQPSNNINSSWPHQLMPVSSPTCCTTNLSHSLLNFSVEKATVTGVVEQKNHLHNQEHSSECNSIGNGGVPKKARVQHYSSPQPALKVRKEKLSDRITALHQIVSPFGKTDTASVLTEAIRHIRFLQAQIQALSGPYMRYSSADTAQHSDSNGVRRVVKDLRSRGLCLVPISYTQHVGNDINRVDYWAPPPDLGGGF